MFLPPKATSVNRQSRIRSQKAKYRSRMIQQIIKVIDVENFEST